MLRFLEDLVNLTTSVSLKVACVAAMMETQSRFLPQYCGRLDDVLRVFVRQEGSGGPANRLRRCIHDVIESPESYPRLGDPTANHVFALGACNFTAI